MNAELPNTITEAKQQLLYFISHYQGYKNIKKYQSEPGDNQYIALAIGDYEWKLHIYFGHAMIEVHVPDNLDKQGHRPTYSYNQFKSRTFGTSILKDLDQILIAIEDVAKISVFPEWWKYIDPSTYGRSISIES